MSQPRISYIFCYLFCLIAKDSQPRKMLIKITVNIFGVLEKASPVGRIKLSANAILTTIPKNPAYVEIASLALCGVGKNISSILSAIRGLY